MAPRGQRLASKLVRAKASDFLPLSRQLFTLKCFVKNQLCCTTLCYNLHVTLNRAISVVLFIEAGVLVTQPIAHCIGVLVECIGVECIS